LIPLILLESGKKAIIRKINGGIGAKQQLVNLGIVEGTIIVLKSKLGNNFGPIMITIVDDKTNTYRDVAIGWGLASKILVEEL